MVIRIGLFLATLLGVLSAGAHGQAVAPTQPAPPVSVQTAEQAIAQDAIAYAKRYAVPPDEAASRLRAQEASIPAIAAVAERFHARLAGVAVEHVPAFRFVLLLTGADPVPDETIVTAGRSVPIVFRTGALATREAMVAAIRAHLPELRAQLPTARGVGLDQRTGEMVLLITSADADRLGVASVQLRAQKIAGVPLRVVINNASDTNLAVGGGGRITGTFGDDPQRFLCTSGYVVSDGMRDGLITAAHCPDNVVYRDPDGGLVPLSFVGQWGWGYQDAQINGASGPLGPLFYADRRNGSLRSLTSWRNRTSTRSGDFVCHYGESSGYSCAEVDLTDFAPPGELCGGPCLPQWVTVRGADCKGGDSGGPVFLGTTAFGILKGANRWGNGRCFFYFYMSTDYLPHGWSLLTQQSSVPRAIPN